MTASRARKNQSVPPRRGRLPGACQGTVARCGALALLLLAGPLAVLAQNQRTLDVPLPELLSRQPGNNVVPNDGSRFPRISLGGERVVFESSASDLDGADGDKLSDIYLLDRRANEYRLVSEGPAPDRVRGNSFDPSVDEGGVLVTFTSEGTHLLQEDDDRIPDVYLKNVADDQIVLISAQRDVAVGVVDSGNDISDQAEISEDGAWIAFRSRAGNLGFEPEPPLPFFHIHIHQVREGVNVRVQPPQDERANGDCFDPDINADGRFVVFATNAANFTPEDKDRETDIVLLEQLAPPKFTLVSVDPLGKKLPGPSVYPRISADGRVIAFVTSVENVDRIAVRDLDAGSTRFESIDWLGRLAQGPSALGDISPDGNVLVFSCRSPLTPDDTNTAPDSYARDLLLGRTLLLSRSPRSFLAGGSAFVNGNGSAIADASIFEAVFFSPSPALASDVRDDNDQDDVFAVGIAPDQGPPPEDRAPSNALHLRFATGQGGTQLRRAELTPGGGAPKLDENAFIDLVTFHGLSVAASNILYVLDGPLLRIFSAATFNEADQSLIFVPPLVNAARIHGMTAFGGAAYIAADATIIKVTPPQTIQTIQFPGDPVSVRLAGDPDGRLWIGARGDGRFELIRVDRNFRPDFRVRRDFPPLAGLGAPYHKFAIGAEGALYLRSEVEVAKLAPNGNAAWRQFLPPGDGLVIDGFGNSYVIAGGNLVSLAPDGRQRFRLPLGAAGVPIQIGGFELALDGASDLWVIARGASAVLRIARPGEDIEDIAGRVDLFDLPQALVLTNGSDVTGFLAANVTGQGLDSDGDNFPNRKEVLRLDNPFDPTPPAAGRFPAIRELRPTVIDRTVRLDWRSPEPFPFFLIRRNGRPLAQPANAEVLDGALGADGYSFTDDAPVGGVNRYVIIGLEQRIELVGFAPVVNAPDGGGAGPAPPESDPAETSVTVGQGEELSVNDELDAFFGEEATAVAIDGDADVLHAATSTRLATFDIFNDGGVPGLVLSDWKLFPIGFPTEPITGLLVDPDDATVLHLMQRDGEVHSVDLDDDPLAPVLVSDLMEAGNAPPGYDSHEHYGLALIGDTFFTVQNSFVLASIEPGVDCLIGWGKSGGPPGSVSSRRTISGPSGIFPCRESSWTGGLAPISGGASLLTGLGRSTATIDEVSAMDVADLGGGNFDFSVGTTGLGLDADTYDEILDFAPGEFGGQDFLAFSASNGRLVLVAAEFPAVQSSTLDVQRVHFADSLDLGILVSYGGTGKIFEELNLGILVDGEEPTLDGPPTVDAGASEATFVIPFDEVPKFTRRFTVSVRSTEGAATCEFIRGFVRGDANDDSVIDVSDAVRILLWLFVGGPVEIPCLDAANVDDSTNPITGENDIDQSDAVTLLNYLFASGPGPAGPFPDFGVDPTADDTTECEE